MGIKYIFQICISKSLINVNDPGGEYVKNDVNLDAVFEEERIQKKSFSCQFFLLSGLYTHKAFLMLSNRMC